MIEVVYKGEKQEEKDAVMLPKNVRQVGEVHRDRKIYIEDYVVTYIKQKITENKNLGCILILTGRREYAGDSLYLFADGAFAVDYSQVGQDYAFTDKVWESVYENVKKHFISSEIVGWLIYDDDLSEDRLLKAQKKNFPTEDMLLLKQEAYEEESVYYLFRNNVLQKLPGFFVYYEKNEAMQEFMVNNYKSSSAEEEKKLRQKEAPVINYRNRMRERKERTVQSRTTGALYAVSSFLVLIVIIIGITMVNNYDKMKNMESSLNELAATAAQNEEELLAARENQKAQEEQAQTASVEVAPAGVEPSAESAGSAGEEQNTGQAGAGVNDGQTGPRETTGQPETEGTGVQDGIEGEEQLPNETPSAENDMASRGQASEEPSQTQGASGDQEASTPTQASPGVYYTVELGDTLAGISKRIYGNPNMVAQICAVNGIEDGDKIQAGQKILLP